MGKSSSFDVFSNLRSDRWGSHGSVWAGWCGAPCWAPAHLGQMKASFRIPFEHLYISRPYPLLTITKPKQKIVEPHKEPRGRIPGPSPRSTLALCYSNQSISRLRLNREFVRIRSVSQSIALFPSLCSLFLLNRIVIGRYA